MRLSWVVPLVVAACAPPSATPRAAEIAELQGRVTRSRSDTESRLRLAAGLWAQGDRPGAEAILLQGAAESADEPLYGAALGALAEVEGDYESARRAYEDFLDRSLESRLERALEERLRHMRGETAAMVARELLEGGSPWDHGMDPSEAVALLPLRAPQDPDLRGLAAAVTELLAVDLEARPPFRVLDWEVSAALARAMPPQPDADADVRALADLLASSRVVRGEIRRAAGDSLVVDVEASLVEGGRIVLSTRDSVRVHLSAYGEARAGVAERTWEILVGGGPGTLTGYPRTDAVPVPALLAMGDGLLLMESGDRTSARRELDRALALAPGLVPLQARVAQLADLDGFQEAPVLPLSEELVRLARLSALQAALHGSAPEGPLGHGPSRQGAAEALGLDRPGTQTIVDIIIQFGGAP